MISNYNLSNLYTSDYRKNLSQFYLDCIELKKDYIDVMKTAYKPSSECEVVVIFDKLVNSISLEIIKKLCFENEPSRILRGSNIVHSAKAAILHMKPTMMMSIEKACAKILNWKSSGLEELLITELIRLPISQENLKAGEPELIIKFWKDCSEKWAFNHGMKKFIPGWELDIRLKNVSEFFVIDCQLFTISYLKLEELFFERKHNSLNEVLKFFREELKYNLVAKAKPNDVIVYLDSSNDPVHFGVFVDEEQVCSKIGQMSPFIHRADSSFYGDSYIILRKPI